ncbi:MAG: hypothetical protein R2681_05070 [Pyrinomonadaceae bacterium]
MKKLLFAGFAFLFAFGFGFSSISAQEMKKNDNPMVGGAAMYKTKILSKTPSIQMIIRPLLLQ